ncbi:MAG: radical SAM protein [Candidatus Wallbacteria bacterium]|nr:radical SAM protein [Candidatus Wallbacteria bacterium]
MHPIAFGPVPSRRLGQSLGINNIPPKVCSFACPYCQAGRTEQLGTNRREFYLPALIHEEVSARIEALREEAERVDHLTFAPDGEPTLDVNLGREIDLLGDLGVPIAVITNSSLLWRHDVRQELARANWVSLKLDAASELAWHRVDRPHRQLDLGAILQGMLAFGHEFKGTLVTETMLVGGANDSPDDADELGRFLARLAPRTAYVSIPIRPPAEAAIKAPSEAVVTSYVETLMRHVPEVVCLMAYEREPFGCTGDAERDILGVVAVHPMREQSVLELLARAGEKPDLLASLLARHLLVRVEHAGETFYARALRRP